MGGVLHGVINHKGLSTHAVASLRDYIKHRSILCTELVQEYFQLFALDLLVEVLDVQSLAGLRLHLPRLDL